MSTSDYRPDQAAVDWARGCVERAAAKLRGFEQDAKQRGDQKAAHTWRVAAYSMEADLIGRGCVIGPFNEHAVEIQAMLDGHDG